jgi:hypothetical protein
MIRKVSDRRHGLAAGHIRLHALTAAPSARQTTEASLTFRTSLSGLTRLQSPSGE